MSPPALPGHFIIDCAVYAEGSEAPINIDARNRINVERDGRLAPPESASIRRWMLPVTETLFSET